MTTADPVSLGKTVVEIAKALLGQLAPILLIASTAFLFMPHGWAAGIGLDNKLGTARTVAGVLWLLSAATCASQFARFMASPIRDRWTKFRADASYEALDPVVKMGLAVTVFSHVDEFRLPLDSNMGQIMLDSGLFYFVRDRTILRLKLTYSGEQTVQRFRARIRKDAQSMPGDWQEKFGAELNRGQKIQEDNPHSWMSI